MSVCQIVQKQDLSWPLGRPGDCQLTRISLFFWRRNVTKCGCISFLCFIHQQRLRHFLFRRRLASLNWLQGQSHLQQRLVLLLLLFRVSLRPHPRRPRQERLRRIVAGGLHLQTRRQKKSTSEFGIQIHFSQKWQNLAAIRWSMELTYLWYMNA